MAALNKEPYLDHYEVIISYYITLFQGSLEEKWAELYHNELLVTQNLNYDFSRVFK